MGASASLVHHDSEFGSHSMEEEDFQTLIDDDDADATIAYQNVKKRYKDISFNKYGRSNSTGSIHTLAIRQLSENLQHFVAKDKDNFKSCRRLDVHIHSSSDEAGDEFPNDYDDIITPTKITKVKPNLRLNLDHSDIDHDGFSATPSIDTKSSLNRIPSDKIRISPRGTFQIGKWRIHETGLSPSNSAKENLKNTLEHNPFKNIKGMKSSLTSIEESEFLEIGALGSGASGIVMEALHMPTLTIVAIKKLHAHNNTKRKQISRELEILYKNMTDLKLIDESLGNEHDAHSPDIGHNKKSPVSRNNSKCPNILSFYNAFVHSSSGIINLVIEYMDGGSLQDLVDHGGCQDEDILSDIAQQALQGLKFLHANKSVHRDIKPANILTSTSGLVKIADFGISKVIDDSIGFANSFVGTMSYMSPERITGESYSYSSDIWSFGLTMLAVAEGKFPFACHSGPGAAANINGNANANAGFWEMVKAICDDDAPTPNLHMSSKFRSFVASCLRKNPSERLTAVELLNLPFLTESKVNHFNLVRESHSYLHSPGSPQRKSSLNLPPSEAKHSSFSFTRLSLRQNEFPADTLPLSTRVQSTVLGKKTSRSTSFADAKLDGMAFFDQQDQADVMEGINLDHLETLLDRLHILVTEGPFYFPVHLASSSRGSSFFQSHHKIIQEDSNDEEGDNTHMHVDIDLDGSGPAGPRSSPSNIKTRRKSLVIPKLFGNTSSSWQNLASQLHLPINLVKLAVKAKFGSNQHNSFKQSH